MKNSKLRILILLLTHSLRKRTITRVPESGPCAASAPSVIPTIHQQGSLHKFCVTIILNFNDRLPTAFKKNTLHQEDYFSVDFTG